ncbi:glycosyltransferase family 2 protein [Nonlabens ponticola]|uniref:glycosyltransferase family 2 protein n=1 Tax=Nonlabens ponticola TaxID=2496866 RepID=UPI0013E04AB9|nr:glycosyltransferase [Nonlabens ponticola]
MQPYTTDDLEILIATMDREDLSFLEVMFSKPLEQIHANILIVNQNQDSKLVSKNPNIKVINDVGRGLSRSRNMGIKNMTGKLGWILDDDCIILPDSIQSIVDAHNDIPSTIITFQTEVLETGDPYWNYPKQPTFFQHQDLKLMEKVLSPEITFKKELMTQEAVFDERFGLGAQFEDSENLVFLSSLNKFDISGAFYPKMIVKHGQHNSSDEPAADRVIYARGALAAFLKRSVFFHAWKYAFFLLRKGLVKSPRELLRSKSLFQKGAESFQKSELLNNN